MKKRKIIRWLATVMVVGCLFFIVGAWVLGGMLIAPANKPVAAPTDNFVLETPTLTSSSGAKICGWFIPADNATATVVLLHPIRANRLAMLGRAKLLRESGFSTLLIDMQAHGESSGDAITAGGLERFDVEAAVDFARSRNPDHKIGVVGCSLGGAAALLAGPLGIDALVVESVYPTISEAIRNRISMRLGVLHYLLTPALVWQLEMRLGISSSQLRPIDKVAEAGCPILIVAGELDQHTTLLESQSLFAAASQPKEWLVFRDAGHADFLKFDAKLYQEKVVGFLEKRLLADP